MEPKYLSLKLNPNEPLELTYGDWVTLAFDVAFPKSDTETETGRFLSFLRGESKFVLSLSVTLAELPAGVEGILRLYELDSQGVTRKRHPPEEWVSSTGLTFLRHTCVGRVDEGNRLSAEIVQFGDASGTISQCAVEVLYWPTNPGIPDISVKQA